MTPSASSSKRVTLLAERSLDSASAPVTSSPTATDDGPRTSTTGTAPASQTSSPAFLEQMLAAMTTIAMMLAARMILFLATVGAFTLTYLAINQGTMTALIAAGTYDVLVVCPMVWLYLQRG